MNELPNPHSLFTLHVKLWYDAKALARVKVVARW